MDPEDVTRAADLLRPARRVLAFTGAGVSAESGVPTFRGAGGLWEGRPVEQVASPEAFQADPLMVWTFYEERRRTVARVRPNPAHEEAYRAAYQTYVKLYDALRPLFI